MLFALAQIEGRISWVTYPAKACLPVLSNENDFPRPARKQLARRLFIQWHDLAATHNKHPEHFFAQPVMVSR